MGITKITEVTFLIVCDGCVLLIYQYSLIHRKDVVLLNLISRCMASTSD